MSSYVDKHWVVYSMGCDLDWIVRPRLSRGTGRDLGICSLTRPEIQYKNPPFPYNLYEEHGSCI
eukprot:884941-Rhodomonas_salina.1